MRTTATTAKYADISAPDGRGATLDLRGCADDAGEHAGDAREIVSSGAPFARHAARYLDGMAIRGKSMGGEGVDETLHRQEKVNAALLEAAGAIGGAAIGAAMGTIAGPPGAAFGAVVGGAIGSVSAATLEHEEHARAQHDAVLDDEIGVTSENLGSVPPPPPRDRAT